MDDILEIITISIAICSLICNILVSLFRDTKSRYVNITTNHRLKNLEYSRNLTAKLLSLTDYNYNSTNGLSTEFIETANALYYYYKSSHVEEREIQMSIEDLVDAYKAVLVNKSQLNEEDLLNKKKIFFQLSKVFEVAYWRYIQGHANAKKQGTAEFEKYYEKTREEYMIYYSLSPKGEQYKNRQPKYSLF